MAGCHDGSDPPALERPQYGDARCQDGGLGVFREIQLLDRALDAKVRKVEVKRRARGFENFAGF
jgi:hypothetical protein